MDYAILETEWPNRENYHQQPPYFSSHILHTYTSTTLKNKFHLHSSKDENSQNKCENLSIVSIGYMQLHGYRKIAI